MGLWNRLRGRQETSPGRGRAADATSTSLAACLIQQNTPLSPGRCDTCGATYTSPHANVFVVAVGEPDVNLDVGGCCPRCRKALCPKHLSYAHVEDPARPAPQEHRDMIWGVVCESCGVQVRHNPDAPVPDATYVVLLPSLGLSGGAERPPPKSEYQAASGRLSLRRVCEAGGPGALGRDRCGICNEEYWHPRQPLVLDLSQRRVSAADIELDVGGRCPTCGHLCQRHAELREVRMQDKPCLAVVCQRHGELLA